jgi:predicted short-subunit dehydrogenase-like oxidoreductase (DUF2520 family)
VLVVGSGPVARALGTAWERAGHEIFRRVARAAAGATLSQPPEVILLAVQDHAIGAMARTLVAGGEVPPDSVLLHAAGALPPEEVFADVRAAVRGVGLCHPLVSLADGDPARLVGATFAVVGDAVGEAVARTLALDAGGKPVILRAEGLGRYHAAAALAANHTLALLGAAVELLVGEGVPRREAEAALGNLLASAAHNVVRLGLPHALTGPIARGEVAVVARHLAALSPEAHEAQEVAGAAEAPRAEVGPAPGIAQLYCTTGLGTVALAEKKGVAAPEALARIRDLLVATLGAEAHGKRT